MVGVLTIIIGGLVYVNQAGQDFAVDWVIQNISFCAYMQMQHFLVP